MPEDPDDLSGVLGDGEADSQRAHGGGQQRVRSRAEAASLAFARLKEAQHTHIYTHIYTYIYICIYVYIYAYA